MNKFDEILKSSDASDALLGEQIDKLTEKFKALDVTTVPNPFTLESGITATIREWTSIKYNSFLWQCIIYLSSIRGISANVKTKLGKINYDDLWEIFMGQSSVHTNVVIWTDSHSAILTDKAIVELDRDGYVWLTTPVALNDYSRMNGIIFTIPTL